MKSNLSLIGMPGAGKSTVGVILAKLLSFGFIDTDILIQTSEKRSLQQIIDEHDHLHLRSIEEREILNMHVAGHVIATGGSAVYSERAMAHLQAISEIVFLRVGYEEILNRVHNMATRGIAKAKDQTLLDLYHERQPLYERYAGSIIDCTGMDQDEITEIIATDYLRRHG